ncbi:MAG: AsmA-like C-terminal region-containing protein [Bacteroidota bacterium]
MKRILIALGILVILFIAALFILPPFFKDDIKAAIDKELEAALDAHVYFDHESLGLSLFSNFPNLTVTLNEFGIVGQGTFEGDTLLDVRSMGLEMDFMKLIKGDITLTGLALEEPHILILSLADGPANYDIVKSTDNGEPVVEEEEPEEDTGEQMTIAIDHWSITDGSFVYYAAGSSMLIDLEGLNLKGGGDITTERFDLATELDIEKVGFEYGDVKYLNGQSVDGEVVLDMNYVDYTFTFKQNRINLNDFGLHFDGFFGMPDEGYDLDLTFASEETTFKSLLSLVPEYYAGDISDLIAAGNVQFDGALKGLYSFEDDGMPAFRFNLRVDEGAFNYPGLPSALQDVNVHLIVDNPDGVMDHTTLDVPTLQLTMGTTGKVEGNASVRGLSTPELKADIEGNLDLHALATALPPETMDGIDLGGAFAFRVMADGIYDADNDRMPKFDVDMNLQNGELTYAEYPIPMKDIEMNLTASNATGTLDDTEVLLKNLHLNLDGDELKVNGYLRNLADYTWKVSATGGLDLDKLAHVVHLEDTELTGKLAMDLTTEGVYSALEAEQYDQLPTNGTLEITNFRYASPDIPMPVEISRADMAFDPRQAAVNSLDMTLGKSDVHLKGSVTNYLAYIMEEGAVLEGTLDFSSSTLDLNELMASDESEEPVTEEVTEDTTSSTMEVVVVPKDVDFTLNSSLTKVYYDELELDNVKGKIVVRGGQVLLDGLTFRTLEGDFAVSGAYDTRLPEDPKVNLDLDIQDVSIKDAYLASGVVRRMAPVAENMTGNFSTDFSIETGLQQDMMPDYGTLTGAGLISIAQAALESGPLVSGITETTKLGNKADGVRIKDIILSAKVENGRVSVRPFDVSVGTYKTTVSGSGGLDGSLDYVLAMDIPAGSAGQAVNNLVSNLAGTQTNLVGETINLNVGLGGTYQEPKFSILSSESTGGDGQNSSLAGSLTNTLQEEAETAVEETTQQVVQAGTDSLKKALESENVQQALQEQAQQAAEEAKNKIRNLFGNGRKRGGGGGK